MLSVQHGRSNPYVRGPVLLLCPHGKSVKLCTSISLGEGQLCRGGQSVCRDTAWVTVGQRPTREHLLHAAWLRRRLDRKIQIWMLSYILSAKFFWQLEAKKTQVVRCHCICERVTKAVISPGKRVAARGKCPLFKFFGLHKHLWKPSSTRVGSPEFGLLWDKRLETPLSGFDGSLCYGNWSRALKAHSACPQLWCSTLTNFVFCGKSSFKTVNKTGTPQWKKLLRVSFWIPTGWVCTFTLTQEGNKKAFTLC